MKSNTLGLLLCLLLFPVISACSRIKSYFPDKEREYQLSAEIPDLFVPPDLTDQAIQKGPAIVYQEPVHQDVEEPRSESIEKENAITVELVEYDGGAKRIRIGDTIERSWRTVGKALSHHSIEIIDRNEADSFYYVQYDPDFKKIEDGSLWDEVLFIFGSDPANEKELRVRLAEVAGKTEVIVLDSNDVPLYEGAGIKLLDLLYKTIKDDLANIQ